MLPSLGGPARAREGLTLAWDAVAPESWLLCAHRDFSTLCTYLPSVWRHDDARDAVMRADLVCAGVRIRHWGDRLVDALKEN